jgi:hypothetical protein
MHAMFVGCWRQWDISLFDVMYDVTCSQPNIRSDEHNCCELVLSDRVIVFTNSPRTS